MKRGIGLHAGSASILVVFVLLCLTTFATLSMVSANADYRLAQKTADSSQRYYRADLAAERYVHEIDEILSTAWVLASNPEGYRLLSQSGLNEWGQAAEIPADWDVGDAAGALDYALSPERLRFRVPIDELQALEVVLELNPYLGPGSGGAPGFRRAAWKVVSTEEIDYETIGDDLVLWDGGDLGALLGG